ncbi:hypothetical protein WI77_27005 [Burkholderia ubonensis]|nr:hypothetical protein WI77_27005 [Burkholderia ubonensis]
MQGGNSGAYQVAVVPMTAEHVRYWHDHVQPIIDSQYEQAGSPRETGDSYAGVRADVGWNWHVNFALAKWWNALRPAADLTRRAVAWCLSVVGEEGQVPIGMLTAVPAYASPFVGDDGKLGFVWYLSDAPAEHYVAVGMHRVTRVASALLDIAIQTRLELMGDASIFLHADPRGGGKLLTFYEDKCGMTRLWDEKRISLVRSVKAGQYFAMVHEQALQFAARFDPLRAP